MHPTLFCSDHDDRHDAAPGAEAVAAEIIVANAFPAVHHMPFVMFYTPLVYYLTLPFAHSVLADN